MKEVWKDIKGYENKYRVSNTGKVWSCYRDALMSIRPNSCGYPHIKLYDTRYARARRAMTIHRLVALAFIPNPLKKPDINHINGIKTDNRVCNLEWITVEENNKHALENGLLRIAPTTIPVRLTHKQTGEVYYFKSQKECDIHFNKPLGALCKEYLRFNKTTHYSEFNIEVMERIKGEKIVAKKHVKMGRVGQISIIL